MPPNMRRQELDATEEVSTAILLGAGASKADGAPLQGDLFRAYFASRNATQRARQMDKSLAAFFKEMFSIDVSQAAGESLQFPTFEEALGLTDLALLRKEAFRGFPIHDGRPHGLRDIARHLIFLVAEILNKTLTRRPTHHPALAHNLQRSGHLRSTLFISTNYDILIDNALTGLHPKHDLDYGVPFRNFEQPDDWGPPRPDRAVRLYKPHGSLNWLYCPTCNDLTLTPKEKGVTRLIMAAKDAQCGVCREMYVPVLVPPSFYKDLSNVFLAETWNRMDNALRGARHIVMCGYSFPDADLHIKYLLKRAQVFRDGDIRLSVVNEYSGKPAQEREAEIQRFRRFWGPKLTYTELSFEQFAEDPSLVIAAR